MFELFTDAARRVTVYANNEAGRWKHRHMGADHLLFGILYEEKECAARALADQGAGYEAVLGEVLRNNKQRWWQSSSRSLPFSSETRKVLPQAYAEALQFRHSFLGPEHLLLGGHCTTSRARRPNCCAASEPPPRPYGSR